MFKRWLLGMMMLLIASGVWSGAFAASESGVELRTGALVELELSEAAAEYTFTPVANALYAVYVFPGSDGARAEAALSLNGETLVRGDGTGRLVSLRMNADTEYSLQVTGSGTVQLEIARETLSRCFAMPLELADGEGYSKLIARSGDVHWYAMAAESAGAALIACAPEIPERPELPDQPELPQRPDRPMESGLRLRLSLFSADGRRISESETLASGTAVLSAAFEAGEVYYIRVAGSGTGKYSLTCQRSENVQRAQFVNLSDRELTITGRATEHLAVEIQPAGASELVYLDSTAADVAFAWSSGYVEGRRDGEAVITAYAYGGARSSCRVTVEPVAAQGVELSAQHLTVTEGESRSLIATVLPYHTTQRRMEWRSSDESIAVVDKNGVVTAVSKGEAEITATAEGGFSATAAVTVLAAQPKYRALLVGEQDYAPTVESVREGSAKSVTSVNSLLNTMSYSDGGYFTVETLMDGSRDEVLAAIREVFAEAREADTSLVYITCHGYYRAGMTFFLMADGSVLSAADLERELRRIPGEIILLLDCCGSGGVIGEAGTTEDLLDGVMHIFQGAVGNASARGSKYRIIASAHLDQDSYRIGFGENGMSTVFARALCDAAGWNMDRSAPSSLNADVDYDGAITLSELGNYLLKRVTWYLNRAGAYAQTVCIYPAHDPSIVFERVGE